MKWMILFIIFWGDVYGKIVLPENYPYILEKLIYFKDDQFKVYFGGPVENGAGARWFMSALFEDENHRVRAVYEISFINCLPNSKEVEGAEIFYLKASDIDLKFRNKLSNEYLLFSGFVNNKDTKKKCLLIREVDVSNIYYPEIFIAAAYSDFMESDKDALVQFLQMKFRTKGALQDLSQKEKSSKKRFVENGLIERKQVLIDIQNESYFFNVDHYYLKDDPWKSYYVVTKDGEEFPSEELISLRIDSGCNSGQIYHDSSCDCLEQFDQGLMNIVQAQEKGSMLIHIPGHDGRGFGVAPKGETEIYKRGGVGRVNQSEMLDTVQAAIHLYRTIDFDIRTYDGCAEILKANKISSVDLLTDNKLKTKTLSNSGILVTRVKTNTEKETCINHIKAKKNSKQYFKD